MIKGAIVGDISNSGGNYEDIARNRPENSLEI
jgi:hypothetical protein